MKNKLLKIFAFLLLLAVVTETITTLWQQEEFAVVLAEKEEKEKDSQKGKEGVKDKLHLNTSLLENLSALQRFFVLHNISFKFTDFLSLPEIPPEQA